MLNQNRLISVTPATGAITYYTYDHLGRRISKQTGTSAITRYIYDGWNLIAEYTGTTLQKSYTWGMDLSGSVQGAGGVGGLLTVELHTGANAGTYHPTYDGNGNISEYLDNTGATVAHYEYDPFGNTLVATGSQKDHFAHRFSTKPLDPETGLYYYGYRYYDPTVGRWLSRDLIEEEGGLNLYGFIGNDAINYWDYLGLNEGALLGSLSEQGNSGAVSSSVPSEPFTLDDLIDVISGALIAADLLVAGPTGEGIIPAAALQGLKQGGKKLAKEIGTCEAINRLYKKSDDEAKGCKPCLTCAQYKLKLAARAAELLGRVTYLKKKCDYVLPGSITSAAGSKGKERTHKGQALEKVNAFGKCAAHAARAGCTDMPKIPEAVTNFLK